MEAAADKGEWDNTEPRRTKASAPRTITRRKKVSARATANPLMKLDSSSHRKADKEKERERERDVAHLSLFSPRASDVIVSSSAKTKHTKRPDMSACLLCLIVDWTAFNAAVKCGRVCGRERR